MVRIQLTENPYRAVEILILKTAYQRRVVWSNIIKRQTNEGMTKTVRRMLSLSKYGLLERIGRLAAETRNREIIDSIPKNTKYFYYLTEEGLKILKKYG